MKSFKVTSVKCKALFCVGNEPEPRLLAPTRARGAGPGRGCGGNRIHTAAGSSPSRTDPSQSLFSHKRVLLVLNSNRQPQPPGARPAGPALAPSRPRPARPTSPRGPGRPPALSYRSRPRRCAAPWRCTRRPACDRPAPSRAPRRARARRRPRPCCPWRP